MQLDLYSSPARMSRIVRHAEESIAAKHAHAILVDWPDDERDPQRTISAAVLAFEDAGWVWNAASRHLEKDGWLIWFRSQGTLSPPIAQWSKIS